MRRTLLWAGVALVLVGAGGVVAGLTVLDPEPVKLKPVEEAAYTARDNRAGSFTGHALGAVEPVALAAHSEATKLQVYSLAGSAAVLATGAGLLVARVWA